MTDLISRNCDPLPTGVWKLEVLPEHEVSGWAGDAPTPAVRWYGIGVYRNSLTYAQNTEPSPMGEMTNVKVGGLLVDDDNALAAQLDAMGEMRFALRVTHYDGKKRLVGRPGQYCTLTVSDYTPAELVGAQGYRLSFEGAFSQRPKVVA